MGQPAKPIDPDHDPVLAAFLSAPIDDWQPTAEQQAELDAAKARAAAGGRMVPHAEVMAAVDGRRSAG
jgi:predicted transcriptional regulator